MIQELYFASQNKNKQKEIDYIFGERLGDVTIKNLSDLDRETQEKFSPEETGTTFLENASIKARELARLMPEKTVFAEDSGLVVPALGGAPGVLSSRYANDDKARIERLLKKAERLTGDSRKAYFFTSVCLIQNEDKIFFHGKIWGEISQNPLGNFGFGYDPIFLLPALDKSFAQLTFEQKQKYSHRKKAIDRLIQFIINNNQVH